MKRYIKSSKYDVDRLGPRQRKEFDRLLKEYNSLKVDETLYTSTTLGRVLDLYFRNHGLIYNEDYICLPFQEGSIVKLSDSEV